MSALNDKPQVVSQVDPVLARRQRALQGLAEGRYHVRPVAFAVTNGDGKAYVVELDPEPTCGCPDYTNRGVRCKHIQLVEMLAATLGWYDLRQEQNGKSEQPEPSKAQSQGVGDRVLPFGKHKGKSLNQVFKEDPGYIRWMATSPKAPSRWAEVARQFLSQAEPKGRSSTQGERKNGGRKPLVLGFGKHKGKSLVDIAKDDPGYLRWLAYKFQPKDGYGQTIQREARALHALFE